MKSISKLKDEARRFEQREEWDKAIQAYLQVVRIGEEGESDVELPLYNRLGDLYVRLGRLSEAVRHYEQAADRYAEVGLYNNAIALCNKALRYEPMRLELIRKLGQFSASQGFLTDARRYFLDYAEQQFKAGKVNDALTALEDFANVSDDAEVRELLGRQLHAHGRTNEAVNELKRAHAMRVRAGQTDVAAALQDEIRGLDPSAARGLGGGSAAAGTVATGPAVPEPDFELDDFEIRTLDDDDDTDIIAPPLQPPPDIGHIGRIEGLEEAEGSDLSDIDVSEFGGGIEGLETTTLDFGGVEPIERTGFGGEDYFDLPEDGDVDRDTGYDLPELGEESDVDLLDDAGPAELPLLDVDIDRPDATTASLDEPSLEDVASQRRPRGSMFGPEEDGDLDDDGAFFELPLLEDEPDTRLDLPTFDTGAPGAFDLPTDEEGFAFDLPPGYTAGRGEVLDVTGTPLDEPVLDLPGLDDVTSGALDKSGVDRPPRRDPLADHTKRRREPAPPIPPPERPVPRAREEAPRAAPPPEETRAAAPAVETPRAGPPPVETRAAPPPVETPGAPAPGPAAGRTPSHVEPARTPRPPIEPPRTPASHAEPPRTAPPAGPPRAAPADMTGVAAAKAPAAPPGEDWLDALAAESEAREEAAPPPSRTQIEDPAAASASAEAARRELAARAEELKRRPPADTGFVDLGAMLSEEEDQREADTRFRVQETAPTGDEDRDFAELLNQFKEKVSEHLPPDDAAAHYDLGLAFKEMGLIDEAIGEFQIALRAGPMRLKVYEELGHCFLQKGQHNIAEKVLRRALDLKFDDELELLGVYYHLGRAYESMGRRDQARDAYERVLGLDINFQDVTERLAQL